MCKSKKIELIIKPTGYINFQKKDEPLSGVKRKTRR